MDLESIADLILILLRTIDYPISQDIINDYKLYVQYLLIKSIF